MIMPITFEYIENIFHIFLKLFDPSKNIKKQGFLLFCFASEITGPGLGSFIQQNSECLAGA